MAIVLLPTVNRPLLIIVAKIHKRFKCIHDIWIVSTSSLFFFLEKMQQKCIFVCLRVKSVHVNHGNTLSGWRIVTIAVLASCLSAQTAPCLALCCLPSDGTFTSGTQTQYAWPQCPVHLVGVNTSEPYPICSAGPSLLGALSRIWFGPPHQFINSFHM